VILLGRPRIHCYASDNYRLVASHVATYHQVEFRERHLLLSTELNLPALEQIKADTSRDHNIRHFLQNHGKQKAHFPQKVDSIESDQSPASISDFCYWKPKISSIRILNPNPPFHAQPVFYQFQPAKISPRDWRSSAIFCYFPSSPDNTRNYFPWHKPSIKLDNRPLPAVFWAETLSIGRIVHWSVLCSWRIPPFP
jgi:hypothetical protein